MILKKQLLLLLSLLMSIGIYAKNSIKNQAVEQLHQVIEQENQARTPFMQLVLDLDTKIRALKYDVHPGVAYLVSAVEDSYFLHGTYAYVGPWVSDMIQANVQGLKDRINRELVIASEKLQAMHVSEEDFLVRDNEGKTVMQYCTTKESYEWLRKQGARFQSNAAIRIYGRHYAPVLLDYVILACVLQGCYSLSDYNFNWDKLLGS
jgi:hypothetical protein